MSTKISIKKILIFVVSLALVMTGLAACTPQDAVTSVVKTDAWDGNQTLEKVLDAVGNIQEGGKSGNELSIDSDFEFYADDLKLSLKVQAYFDLADRKARQNEEGYLSKDVLLIELADADTFERIGGVYVRENQVYVTVAGLNFTLSDIDALKGVGEGVSSVMGVDLGAALGGLDLPIDITSILGGFLFPSATVVTESPLKGNSGETVTTITADMDIDTVLGVVFGMFSMVNDMVGDIGGSDIDTLLNNLAGFPLITKYEGGEVVGELGLDEILSDLIGLKPVVKDGVEVYAGKPFAGTKLKMIFVDDSMTDFEIVGKYTPYEKDPSAFGFKIVDFEVSNKGIVINLPLFASTFDFYSLRLGGVGTIPDVGDIVIVFDVKLDPKDYTKNKIAFEVTKKESGENVIAGYYQYEKIESTDNYEGYVYLNLEAVDISYIKVNAQRMGIGKIKIGGVDIMGLMNTLIADLTNAANGIISASGGAVSESAVYGISEGEVILDLNYVTALLASALTTGDGRIDVDITTEMIAQLLADVGLEKLIDGAVDGVIKNDDGTINEGLTGIFDAVKLIGLDIAELVSGLGNKVVSFITGLDPAVKLSAYVENEDRNGGASYGPGLGLELTIDGQAYYIDLFVVEYGNADYTPKMPDDLLTAYKPFDYSTVSFSGTASVTNVGDVTYRLTVSGIDTIKTEGDGSLNLSGLKMSWVAYDYNKAVIMGVYYDGADGKAYVDLGSETRFLGFKFSDMGLDRLYIDINLETIVNEALGLTTKPSDAQATGAADGEEADEPFSLAKLLEFLTIEEFHDGKVGAELTNANFVSFVTELVGAEAMERLEAYLPPVSAKAYLDALNLMFGFNVDYFNERIAFEANLQSLYIGTDEANGIFAAAELTGDEKVAYKNIDEIMTGITLIGTIDLPGPSMKDLTFEMQISGLLDLDLDHLKISVEAKIADNVLFSVYYDQEEKAALVDLGLLNVFGLDIAKMNIQKIKIPGLDLAAQIKAILDGVDGGTGGGSVTGGAAEGDPLITLNDLFGWVTGEYVDGKITIGTKNDRIVLDVLQKVLEDNIYSYIKGAIPPAVLSVALDTNIGELGVSLQIALETISFKLEKLVFGTGVVANIPSSVGYNELSVEGLMDNIVIQGVATVPGGAGRSNYTLIISDILDSTNFAVSLETVNANGEKDFSLYYSLANKAAYVDFGSFSIFAIDPAFFNIKKLKLLNLTLDVGTILREALKIAAPETPENPPLAEGGSVAGSSADEPVTIESMLQALFDTLVFGYDEAKGEINVSLFEESFVQMTMDTLGEALYARIGALIPGAEAVFAWDTVNGIIDFGFGTYQTTDAGRDLIDGVEIGISRIYFGVDSSVGTDGKAVIPGDDDSYKTLENVLQDIQILGTGTLPGAGEVSVEINLHVNLSTTANSELSFVMKYLTGDEAGKVAFALYNFGEYIYADIGGFFLGEINPGGLLASKIKMEGINVADMIQTVLGDIIKQFSDIGSEPTPTTPPSSVEIVGSDEYQLGETIYDNLVTLVYNNGATPSGAVIGVNNGDTIPVDDLNKAQKEGFVIDGWYSDMALTQIFDTKAPITEVGEITLYAKQALWYDTTTFIQIYNIINAELSPLHAQINITPDKWNQLVTLLFEVNLNAIIAEFSPSISLDVNLMDLFGVGFDLSVNNDKAAGTKDNVLGFRVTSFQFGTSTTYKEEIEGATGEYAFKHVDDILKDFKLNARVEMDIDATLNTAVVDDTLNQFINNILTQAGTAVNPLGKLDIVYADKANIKYGIIADIGIDRNDIYNTDILIELWRGGTKGGGTLMLGFYIDDGIGYIDLSGLVGDSGYNNNKGLRLAINEVNIMGMLQKMIPDTLDELLKGTGGTGGTSFSTLSGGAAAAPQISLDMSAQLMRTLMGLLSGSVDGAEDPIPNLDFENFTIDVNNLSASGIVKAFDSAPAYHQLALNVSANIELSRDVGVNFGDFKANKSKFILFNAKASANPNANPAVSGLGELGVILSLIDNTMSNDGTTTELFSGTILVQNKESINNKRPDTNYEDSNFRIDRVESQDTYTQKDANGNERRYYSADNLPVGDGQTSDIYIFKIRDGAKSGANDPQKDNFSYDSSLNGALGILIDVSYNFSVKVPNIQFNGTGDSTFVIGGNNNIRAQGDLDMAYFFALKEDALNVYARIGGIVNLSDKGLSDYYRIDLIFTEMIINIREEAKSELASFDTPQIYELIELASLPISIKDIANGIELPEGGSEIITGIAATTETQDAPPMIKGTTINITSDATSIDIDLDAQVLDAALVEFENGFLASLAPGATVDIDASSSKRYVAETVWSGVAGMITSFVMAAGAKNPKDDLWITGMNYGNAETTFHGASTSGREDMMRFINALLPLPRMNEHSTAQIKLGFKSGKLSTVDVVFMGVITAGKQEKLILHLEHRAGVENLGLNPVTGVQNANNTAEANDVLKEGTKYFIAADAFATLVSYENIKTSATVSYEGKITKEQNVSWDFTPIRNAIADGTIQGHNGKFTIGGYVGNSGYGAKMDVYIINGTNDPNNTAKPGTYHFTGNTSYGTEISIDPYDGMWKSNISLAYSIVFNLDYNGQTGQGSTSGGFSLDTSAVPGDNSSFGNKYAAYLRWNGLTEQRMIYVQNNGTKKISKVNIPETQFLISNIGNSIDDYNTAIVEFEGGYSKTYSVQWANGINSATNGKAYGTVVRQGTIKTPTETYNITQTNTIIYLMTNRVEYRNGYGPSVNQDGPLMLSTKGATSENQGRIYFIDVDGKAKFTTVNSVNVNDLLSYGDTVENPGSSMTVYNGGNYDYDYSKHSGNSVSVTLNSAEWNSSLKNVVVPVQISYGPNYTVNAASGGSSGGLPRQNLGHYVDTSVNPDNAYNTNNSVYVKVVTVGGTLTSNDMPTMTTQAAIYVDLAIATAALAGTTIVSAYAVAELRINWDFSNVDFNVVDEYEVVGRMYYRNLDTKTQGGTNVNGFAIPVIKCIVKVVAPS
jgi:hypothetical protein